MSSPGGGAEVVAELARRFQTGDGAGAFGLFHPEIRIEQPASLPHGGWHQGHEGVATMGTAFGRVWSRAIASPRILAYGAVELEWTPPATTTRSMPAMTEAAALCSAASPEAQCRLCATPGAFTRPASIAA
jgi:uncharacterized protein